MTENTLRKSSTLRLLLTGFVQVLLVSLNVYQISHQHFLGAAIVGFLISLVWTLNVKTIAFGGWRERILYSSAACAGTIAGMIIPHFIP